MGLEMSTVMTGWQSIAFSEAISKVKVGRENQILSSEIMTSGLYPVVDQGQAFIAGYSNEVDRVIREELPMVIFGDHTRCIKYVDFPFVIGADGTKVLKPREDLFDTKFFYYALLSLDIPNRGYNRHFTLLKEKTVPCPARDEQRKIADALGVVQQAIEQQEQLLQRTTELKKTLLHQLFTQGLRGEPQKQTEIGPVPESWEVVTLESVSFSFDYGTSVKCEKGKSGFPVLRIPNVVWGAIDLADLKMGQPKPIELETLRLRAGDLLFVRTNGVLENAGRCAIYRGELEDSYFASYLIRVRTDATKLLPAFLNEYAQTERGRSFLSGKAIRTADGKFNINSGTLKRVLLPLPRLDEQKEIIRQLHIVEQKLKFHQAKTTALNDLFRSLLHQLMTAQIRVDELEIPDTNA